MDLVMEMKLEMENEGGEDDDEENEDAGGPDGKSDLAQTKQDPCGLHSTRTTCGSERRRRSRGCFTLLQVTARANGRWGCPSVFGGFFWSLGSLRPEVIHYY